MNHKDVAHFRRQFKIDHDPLKIFHILHVYIMKESSEIYHHEYQPFAMLERDQQELFIGNFKKMLAGQLDQKLFAIKFQPDAPDHTRPILYEGLQTNDVGEWNELMLQVVDKLLKDFQYDEDVVITFIRGEYFKPKKSRNEGADEGERDEVYALPFIICTINKTEEPQRTIVFDYISKQFKYNVAVDPILKLASPEGGFLFPCFNDGFADVNHVLYSTGRANEPDFRFIEDVLNGELQATAQQDKAIFEDIVREVAGEQLHTATLAQVYEEIHRIIDEHEEEDPATLDYRDVERVLAVSGVEDVNTEKVEQAYQLVTDDRNYELKANNIIPKFTSKSIKINTKVASISISPQDLKYVKQVNYQGKRCILIEVDEDTVIEGFTMKTETL